MKHVFAMLFLVVMMHSMSSAQWVQTSGPSGGQVTRLVTNPANGYLFAVANGDLYRSTDAGANWAPVTNALPGNLGASVVAASGTNVYINYTGATDAKIVYRSTDNGDTWALATCTGLPPFYLSAAMIVAGPKLLMSMGYLLGGAGKIFSSTDAGENWTESDAGLPASYTASNFTLKGAGLFAASGNGIYKSTDNGANWSKSNSSIGGIGSLSANSSYVFVSTSTTGVYRCNGNDTTWTKINPGSISGTNFSTAVHATSTNLFIGVGGFVFRADQNGDTWDSVRTGLPPANSGTAIYNIATSGSSVLCSYAKHGIYRSTDNGSNWFQSHNGLKALKIDGILASNGFLFAAGDQYGFFRSPDRGNSWVEINNGVAATAGWFCFARVGADLLGGAGSGLLYRSSDNGDNWILSNTGYSLTSSFAFVVEGSTVHTTGYAGIAKSTDGGLNWATLPAGYLFYETGLDIWKDGPNILTGTNVASHRSTDDGASWGTTSGAVAGFAQIDTTLFLASASGVKKSTDHGASWTSTASLPFGVGPQCLTAIGTDLFAGTSDGVYRSPDAGASWTAMNQGLAPKTAVYKITYDDQYLYAGTTNRSVWRRPLAEITAVEESNLTVPSKFALAQNYPNPFNPATRIRFQITERTHVTLKVYNIMGCEVATLVNESLAPGSYTTSWDAGSISSGMYFCRLTAGTVSQVRTMMFVK